MIKSNFHTHTNYCDGKNTAEELVISALEKGFFALGFSSHSFYEPDKDISMSYENELLYRKEITDLKAKYRDKIEIYLGIEQDIYSEKPDFNYDYIIGSVHNIEKSGEVIMTDFSPEETARTIDFFYNGDYNKLAKDYFSLCEAIPEKTGADIIGHIDLITKFDEILNIKRDEEYYILAEKCIKKLCSYNIPFEINTGAMARGYRNAPYPDEKLLKMIKAYGGRIAISSDCHDKDYLDFGFAEAERLAKKIGFCDYAIISENKIKYINF